MKNEKKALSVFLIIVFIASAIIEGVWIYFGESATQSGISTILMFMPFISAVIVSKIFYKKQRSLGFNRCNFIYVVLAVLIPFIYLILSYGLFWLFAKGSYVGSLSELKKYAENYSGKDLPGNLAVIISLIITLPLCFITAFGEEVGWRGFMYPIMDRLWDRKKAVIISGGIWAIWHLPLVITGLYLPDTIMIYRILAFIVEVFSVTVIITWIRIKSNSVWTAILFHTIHNYLDQVVLHSLTNHVKSAYFVGETGCITIAITALIAFLILIRTRFMYNIVSKKLF